MATTFGFPTTDIEFHSSFFAFYVQLRWRSICTLLMREKVYFNLVAVPVYSKKSRKLIRFWHIISFVTISKYFCSFFACNALSMLQNLNSPSKSNFPSNCCGLQKRKNTCLKVSKIRKLPLLPISLMLVVRGGTQCSKQTGSKLLFTHESDLWQFPCQGKINSAISIYVVGSKPQAYKTRPKGDVGSKWIAMVRDHSTYHTAIVLTLNVCCRW